MNRVIVVLIVLLLGNSGVSRSAVVHVTSIAALQSEIHSAAAGDTIVLADGTYLDSKLTIGTSNLTIRAGTPGGVYLNGTTSIVLSGSHITFSGFQFTSGDIGAGHIIEVSGSHNVLTQLNFSGYHAKEYIVVMGGTQYNEISHCNIENKPMTAASGCLIQIHTSPTVVAYHSIRYCSFRNFPGPGGDFGNEPIRIGLGAERENVSRTIVEYCYFENVGLGDSESISVKSCENVCRYNTFTNNPKGMLVFRQGNRNIAYGNFFIHGSGGIRIKCGNNHFVYNNYFETDTADALTLQYVAENPLKNINIVHNTFVEMGAIKLGSDGPVGVTFANNIFTKDSGQIFSNPTGIETWVGNIVGGTLGIPISSGMTSADPGLVRNTDGYFGLSASSPAIDAASSDVPPIVDIEGIDDDPFLLLDIDGQPRPAAKPLKDVGCDEYVKGKSANHPLTLSEVGPSYGYSSSGSQPNTTVSIKGEDFFVNDEITLKGKTLDGISLEGLLPNARMVQGIFDDLNPGTRHLWKYPDTGEWNASRNTDEFIVAMPEWHRHGLLAFTLNMQGGSPTGYGNKGWINPGYQKDGRLRDDYAGRLEKILSRADELGMVVILGLFYFGQDQHLENEAAVVAAVNNTLDWLFAKRFRNVIIEINNECNSASYDHQILKPARVHELIELVKRRKDQQSGYRFPVSTSYSGGHIPLPNVVRVSDLLFLHGNGVKDPTRISEMVELTRKVEGYRPMPIVFNEDDHYDFDKPVNNMISAFKAGASWGYFDFRKKGETLTKGDSTLSDGYQSIPVDWGITSRRKEGFFGLLAGLSGMRTAVGDSVALENAYVRVMRNVAACPAARTPGFGTRVVVALTRVTMQSSRGSLRLKRGEIAVFLAHESYTPPTGEFFEVAFKTDHPPAKGPAEWIEPQKNTVTYEDGQFRIFEERLASGDTRELHSHAQRIVVRLNEVQLTDPRYNPNGTPGGGIQAPNTVRFAEPVVHVVRNLSAIPLFNVVIELKVSH